MGTFCKSGCIHKLLQTNIAVGLLVTVTAVFFIISGEYANLEMRQQSETLLNFASIGGLVFSAAAWFLDLIFHPQFSETDS